MKDWDLHQVPLWWHQLDLCQFVSLFAIKTNWRRMENTQKSWLYKRPAAPTRSKQLVSIRILSRPLELVDLCIDLVVKTDLISIFARRRVSTICFLYTLKVQAKEKSLIYGSVGKRANTNRQLDLTVHNDPNLTCSFRGWLLSCKKSVRRGKSTATKMWMEKNESKKKIFLRQRWIRSKLMNQCNMFYRSIN